MLTYATEAFLNALYASAPLLLISISSAGLVGVVALFLQSREQRAKAARVLLGHAVMFGLLGALIGFGMGASREPAVAAVIPAVLTLVGAALAYLFNRTEATAAAAWKLASVPAASALLLSCLVATILGGQARSEVETHAKAVAFCEKHYETLLAPSCASALASSPAADDRLDDETAHTIRGQCLLLMSEPHPCTRLLTGGDADS